jgi:hypothetical protein
MMSKYSNYCMLAYGITGAGKTFTLEGEANRSHSLRPERERELTVCSHSRD